MKHLNALQSFFLAVVVSLVVFGSARGLAAAAAPFEDDYNSYSAGALAGQGGWANYFTTGTVQSAQAVAGNAVEYIGTNGSDYKSGTPLNAGSWFFHFKLSKGSGTPVNNADITFINGGYSGFDNSLSLPKIKFDGTNYHLFSTGLYDEIISLDQWYSFGVSWSAFAPQNTTWFLDNVQIGTRNSVANDINTLHFGLNTYGGVSWNFYIDNITSAYLPITPPAVLGYDPILEPTTPPRNASTYENFDNFTESGTITIPDLNPRHFYHLNITYLAVNSLLPAAVSSIYLPALGAGDSYSYSATTTIPVTSPGNNYFKVQYSVDGESLASWPLLSFDDTWVTDHPGGGTPPPSILIPAAIQPGAPAMEDCGAYSGIDAVMCNFKNFIVGAFLPSNAALNQLSTTMSAFKNKFPMNYATAISATLSNIAAGVDDSHGFVFSLFGNSGTVDVSIFSKDFGAGVTLGGTIKLLITFLALVVFFLWGMGYMHRIFAK